MVKHHDWTEFEASNYILLWHVGNLGREDPKLWHLVYAYTWEEIEPYYYMFDRGWQYPPFPTIEMARDAAKTHAALGQVTTDYCPMCRYDFDTFYGRPRAARWNIYHGQRGETLVPIFVWDARLYYTGGAPPPGYSWDMWTP